MYQPEPQYPAFSKETLKAIQDAVKGKVESLWETDLAITNAILVDTSLTPLQKATEVARAMHRFTSTANGYIAANSPLCAIGDMGFNRPFMNPMYGTEPGGRYPVPTQHPGLESLYTNTYVVTADDKTEYTISLSVNALDNKINNIAIISNGLVIPPFPVFGILNDPENNDGVAIGIMIPPTMNNDQETLEVFTSIMTALELTEETDKFGYSVRTVGEDSMLYIDLQDTTDATEVENFNDIVKGYFNRHSYYDKLFSAAAE